VNHLSLFSGIGGLDLQRNGPVSKQSPLWSETPTANECSANDGLESPALTTFGQSPDRLWPSPQARDYRSVTGREPEQRDNAFQNLNVAAKLLPLSPVGSLANLIPLQESVRRLLTTVTSGRRLPVSFARFARDGSSGRMFAVSSTASLDGSSAPFSGTWPTWGIALDGVCGELPTLEHYTSANESSSWPTPTTRDYKDGSAKACANVPANGLLGRVVHQRPPGPLDGSLNPMWVEWLMGFPLGWTALEPSEMPSSRSKPIRSLPKSPESRG
jgi:hypothetical protein